MALALNTMTSPTSANVMVTASNAWSAATRCLPDRWLGWDHGSARVPADRCAIAQNRPSLALHVTPVRHESMPYIDDHGLDNPQTYRNWHKPGTTTRRHPVILL